MLIQKLYKNLFLNIWTNMMLVRFSSSLNIMNQSIAIFLCLSAMFLLLSWLNDVAVDRFYNYIAAILAFFPPPEYTVKTRTGFRENANTDDYVHIHINDGTRGLKLNNRNRNDFEWGHTNTFTIRELPQDDGSHFVFMAHRIKQVRTSQFKATVLRCDSMVDSMVDFSRISKAIFNRGLVQ